MEPLWGLLALLFVWLAGGVWALFRFEGQLRILVNVTTLGLEILAQNESCLTDLACFTIGGGLDELLERVCAKRERIEEG